MMFKTLVKKLGKIIPTLLPYYVCPPGDKEIRFLQKRESGSTKVLTVPIKLKSCKS